MKFMSINSRLYRLATGCFDGVLIGLLTILTSILTLGIGIGGAFSAACYTIDNSIIQDNGYIIKTFIKSFKSDFKNSLIWIPLGLLNLALSYSLLFMYINNLGYIIYLALFIGFELLMTTIILFTLRGLMDFNSSKDYIINAIRLTNGHLIKTLLLFVCFLISVLTIYLLPPSMVIIIPLFTLFTVWLIKYKIITSYRLKKS
ncbi:DUF624 domain-containing protein [Acidaminobacter sp. JC074]|uniref:DUF624 domain-containing protein n=1 Tax=Acidaminobacter sp. JC074 TaxID=2530199 RepID=UPI001F1052B9|nr:DUF624 domain-containing protein [Acidaminobacter sp. JC074]MCH4887619.1 DUF624 domain-containing protein [Acidaminobacter sp. JC074]